MKEVKDGFFWIDPEEFAGLRVRRDVTLVRRCIKDLEVGDHVMVAYLAHLSTKEELAQFVKSPRSVAPVTGKVEVVSITPRSNESGLVGDVVVRIAPQAAAVPQPTPPPSKEESAKAEVP